MGLRNLTFGFLIILFGWIQASAQTTSDKSYQIPHIQSEVTINADGTVDITEHLTYNYEGSFSWAEYRIPREGFTAIKNIRISEGDSSYINRNNEEKGTFSVAQNEDAIKLTWHYSAEDEKRIFTISYTLEGALTVGSNWSQFYWNFLSDDREKSTDLLQVSISLPKSVAIDSLHGWTQSPLRRMELEKEQGKFIVTGRNIDNSDFAKVRAVFPTAVLENPQITNQNFTLSQAKQQEQAYEQRMAELKEWKQYWADVGPKIHYAIIFLAIIIFYFLYQKFGKRPSTSHLADTETVMIPGRQSPAEIGWLLSGRFVQSVHLVSTLLDLARRGYFKIREEEPEEGMFEDDDPTFSVERTDQTLQDDLLDWEREIIQFVEKRLDSETQKIDDIFDSSNSDVSGWFNDWKKQLKEYCFSQNWIDLKSYTGAYWNVGIQLVLFFGTFGLLFYAGQDYAFDFTPSYWISWFAAILVTAATAFSSIAIIRPTEKGAEVKHKWNNYKEGLENAKKHTLSEDTLDKHFIYALAFGLKEEKLENIFTTSSESVPAYTWIVFSAHHSSSASAIASSFSALGATGAAAAPGSSGGAGASAGAAGGGAAASAG